MRRVWPIYLLTVLVLGLAALGTWFSNHPESPWLERAQGWPLVGPWAQKMRQSYLPAKESPKTAPRAPLAKRFGNEELESPRPSTASSSEAPAEADPDSEARVVEPLLFGALPFEWFQAGTAVREAPRRDAEPLLRLENAASLTLLNRRGDWARVKLGSRRGWVRLAPDTILQEPPFGSAPEPVRPVRGRAPDAQRLRTALELMSRDASAPTEESLGPYALHTDWFEPFHLADLDRLTIGVEDTYRQRYGTAPQHPPAEAVLLFAREEDYRIFQGGDQRLASLQTHGHAGSGLVALYASDRQPEEIAATLVHELTHLINRRAVGPALPPWLDEGLAEDLAFGRIADDTLSFDELGGQIREEGARVVFYGARSALKRLEDHRLAGTLMPLERLVAIPWETFVTPPAQRLYYAQSGFFVRFLLGDAERAAAFRSFLEKASEGREVSGGALVHALGTDWASLNTAFETWLADQARQYLPAMPAG